MSKIAGCCVTVMMSIKYLSATVILSPAAPSPLFGQAEIKVVVGIKNNSRSDSDIPLSPTHNLSLLTSVPMVMMMEEDSPNSSRTHPFAPTV